MKALATLALLLGAATAQSCNTANICGIVNGCAQAVNEYNQIGTFCGNYLRTTTTRTMTNLAKPSTVSKIQIVTVTGTSSLTTTTTILASPVLYTTTAACAPTEGQSSSFSPPGSPSQFAARAPVSSSLPTPVPLSSVPASTTAVPSCLAYGAYLGGRQPNATTSACYCMSATGFSPVTTSLTVTATPSPVTATRFGTVHLYTQVVKVVSTTITPTYTVVMDADPNFCAAQTGSAPTSSSGTAVTTSSSTSSTSSSGTVTISPTSSSTSRSSSISSSTSTTFSSSSSSGSSTSSSSSTISNSSTSSSSSVTTTSSTTSSTLSSSISSSSSSIITTSSSTTTSQSTGPTANANNLVQDWSFEQDSLSSFAKRSKHSKRFTSPWTIPFDPSIGGGNIAGNAASPGILGNTPAGSQYAILDAGTGSYVGGSVSQTITGLSPGLPYAFAFYEAKQFSMYNTRNVLCTFEIQLPGQAEAVYESWNGGKSGYAWHSNGWSFTPNVTYGVLKFAHYCNGSLGENDYSYYGVDAIQIYALP